MTEADTMRSMGKKNEQQGRAGHDDGGSCVWSAMDWARHREDFRGFDLVPQEDRRG